MAKSELQKAEKPLFGLIYHLLQKPKVILIAIIHYKSLQPANHSICKFLTRDFEFAMTGWKLVFLTVAVAALMLQDTASARPGTCELLFYNSD